MNKYISHNVSLSPQNVALYKEKCDNLSLHCGPGSSVSIATDYGLDDPGINFTHKCRPALGPIQRLVQWVPGLSRGKAARTWCWPSTPSSAEVTKGYSYISIHPLGLFSSVTGLLTFIFTLPTLRHDAICQTLHTELTRLWENFIQPSTVPVCCVAEKCNLSLCAVEDKKLRIRHNLL
jgi:hypothetical protein